MRVSGPPGPPSVLHVVPSQRALRAAPVVVGPVMHGLPLVRSTERPSIEAPGRHQAAVRQLEGTLGQRGAGLRTVATAHLDRIGFRDRTFEEDQW